MFFYFSFVFSFEIPTRLITYYHSIFNFYFYFSFFYFFSFTSIVVLFVSATHGPHIGTDTLILAPIPLSRNSNTFPFDCCSRSLFHNFFRYYSYLAIGWLHRMYNSNIFICMIKNALTPLHNLIVAER